MPSPSKRSRALIASQLGAALATAMVAGCGISMRYVVESDMRFEHCYRIDEDGRTPLDLKRECWREWTATYQKGQDRSRVAYATERLRVLDAAATPGAAPLPSAAGSGAPPSVAVLPSSGTTATPISPYKPPPSIATGGPIGAVNDSPAWQTCSEECGKTWKSCAPACNGQMPCVTGCEERYRVCMKACF